MVARAVSLNFVIILNRCYGKQRGHFEIFYNMADTRGKFKLNFELVIILKRCYGKQIHHFKFLLLWRHAWEF
jgi:hypothetical protein